MLKMPSVLCLIEIEIHGEAERGFSFIEHKNHQFVLTFSFTFIGREKLENNIFLAEPQHSVAVFFYW